MFQCSGTNNRKVIRTECSSGKIFPICVNLIRCFKPLKNWYPKKEGKNTSQIFIPVIKGNLESRGTFFPGFAFETHITSFGSKSFFYWCTTSYIFSRSQFGCHVKNWILFRQSFSDILKVFSYIKLINMCPKSHYLHKQRTIFVIFPWKVMCFPMRNALRKILGKTSYLPNLRQISSCHLI